VTDCFSDSRPGGIEIGDTVEIVCCPGKKWLVVEVFGDGMDEDEMVLLNELDEFGGVRLKSEGGEVSLQQRRSLRVVARDGYAKAVLAMEDFLRWGRQHPTFPRDPDDDKVPPDEFGDGDA
jgi:hypothetical protein